MPGNLFVWVVIVPFVLEGNDGPFGSSVRVFDVPVLPRDVIALLEF